MSRTSPTAPHSPTTFRKRRNAAPIAHEIHDVPPAPSAYGASTTSAHQRKQLQRQLPDSNDPRDEPAALHDPAADAPPSPAAVLRHSAELWSQQLFEDDCAADDASAAAEEQCHLAPTVHQLYITYEKRFQWKLQRFGLENSLAHFT